ncbi:MAG TPA: hypothetical protein VKV79_01970, partial [Terriglobia bacterium]|nr:hypothetical protein [Terriglobia bacterium]
LVYGARAAEAMKAGRGPAPWPEGLSYSMQPVPQIEAEGSVPANLAELEAIAGEIRRIMWNSAGIIRKGGKLNEAARRLAGIRLRRLAKADRQYYETENLLDAARLIVSCARAREESRGAHYRADFPLRNDAAPPQHSFIARGSPVVFRPYDGPPTASVRGLTLAS